MTLIRLLALACLAVAVTATASAGGAPPPGAPPAAPTVGALRVQLFENKSGRLSDDVLSATPGGVWNSHAGPQAANAALVVVEVRGQADASYSGRPGTLARYGLRLVATERTRPLLDQTQPLPVMGPDGRTHVAFLLRHGGCAPLQLRASVVGRAAGPAVEVLVPFACGE